MRSKLSILPYSTYIPPSEYGRYLSMSCRVEAFAANERNVISYSLFAEWDGAPTRNWCRKCQNLHEIPHLTSNKSEEKYSFPFANTNLLIAHEMKASPKQSWKRNLKAPNIFILCYFFFFFFYFVLLLFCFWFYG